MHIFIILNILITRILFLKIRAIENVRYALRNGYDYFDEEIYATAVEVFERQKAAVSEKIEFTGIDIHRV